MGSERDRALVFESWRQYEDDSRVGAEAKARAIIAAVDAQHPAPALPREVLTRVAEEAVESVSRFEAREVSDTIDAIVSRHLPTDEEREAADAVVEAALAEHEAWEAIADSDEWEMPAKGVGAAAARSREACLRLLAIRAKRGAR